MLSDEEVLEKARELLLNHALCDRCLGRFFASYGLGLSNALRGRALKTVLAMEIHKRILTGDEGAVEELKKLAANGGDVFQGLAERYLGSVEPNRCEVCEGRLDGLLGELVIKTLNRISTIEGRSFLVGVRKGSKLELREKQIAVNHGLIGWESIRREVKREVGKRIQRMTNLRPDFKEPEITVIIDLDREDIAVNIRPIYLRGSYVKLGRFITQMKWVGRKGRNYSYSVEESVRKVSKAFKAADVVLHASGREDADARMLGWGRPIILELKSPLKRTASLDEAGDLGSSPPWVLLRLEDFTTPSDVKKLKTGSYRKIYRAVTYVKEGITQEEIERIVRAFTNIEVSQRTPTRVLRRRGDTLRVRKVYEVRGLKLSQVIAEFIIKCDGGLYVKELINGDNGRTKPYISSVIGREMEVLVLDVLKHEGMDQ